MEPNIRILVVLATVVVATECHLGFIKREEYQVPPHRHQSPCLNAVITCTAPLQHNPLFQNGFDQRTLITHIDEVCQIYEEVESCLRPSVDECDLLHLQSQLRAGLSVGDFLCSSRGRSLLREVQNSVCYTNPSKVYELQIATQICVAETAESERRSYDICQQYGVAQRCLVQTATQECGEAAGEVITEIFDRIISALRTNHCSNEEHDEYLKRGLDWFRK